MLISLASSDSYYIFMCSSTCVSRATWLGSELNGGCGGWGMLRQAGKWCLVVLVTVRVVREPSRQGSEGADGVLKWSEEGARFREVSLEAAAGLQCSRVCHI